jgi:hypothetical protein
VNAWYAAGLGVLLVALAAAVGMPGLPDCPNGLNECGGFQLSPLFVTFAGALVAGILAFVGFIRSMR